MGIPVICIDTDDPNSKRYAYIGTDNYYAGRQTGVMLARAIGGKGEVALLMIPGQLNIEERARVQEKLGEYVRRKTGDGRRHIAIGCLLLHWNPKL